MAGAIAAFSNPPDGHVAYVESVRLVSVSGTSPKYSIS